MPYVFYNWEEPLELYEFFKCHVVTANIGKKFLAVYFLLKFL